MTWHFLTLGSLFGGPQTPSLSFEWHLRREARRPISPKTRVALVHLSVLILHSIFHPLHYGSVPATSRKQFLSRSLTIFKLPNAMVTSLAFSFSPSPKHLKLLITPCLMRPFFFLTHYWFPPNFLGTPFSFLCWLLLSDHPLNIKAILSLWVFFSNFTLFWATSFSIYRYLQV